MRLDATAAQARSVDDAIDDAVRALWAQQRSDGSWEGYVTSAGKSTAFSIMALQLADHDGSAELITRGVDWLLAGQNSDGGWGDLPGMPSSLGTTAAVVAALTMTRPADTTAIERGKRALENLGVHDAMEDSIVNVTVRTTLGLAGLYDWRRVPRVPVEVALLPDRMQRHVSVFRPIMYAVGIMHAHLTPRPWILRPITRLAERRAVRHLKEVQDIGGPQGGGLDSPPTLGWIIIGLAKAGVCKEMIAHYTDYLRRLVQADGSWSGIRDLELSATCYVIEGMVEAGCGSDPRLRPAIEWVRASQREVPVRGTGCPAGGWGWSMPSSWPDTDDTAHATRLLSRLGGGVLDEQVRAGAAWLRAMQNRDGSWSCFARHRGMEFDAPCTAMTTQAMEALHEVDGNGPEVERAVRWLEREQRADGSMPTKWYRNSTAGTAWTIVTLSELGRTSLAVARQSLRWLLEHQSVDGGWGDGQGPSTVEETAWGLLALTRVDPHSEAAAAAAAWLVARQRSDGLWDASAVCYYSPETPFWCTEIANGFALQALARYRNAVR